MNNTPRWYTELFISALSPTQLQREVCRIFYVSGPFIFNDTLDNHGNFAHYLPIFLFEIQNINIKYAYMNLIFYLIEYNLIDMHQINEYNSIPIDIIDFLYKHRKEYTILKWIYNKRLALVQQSIVRRWLAKRKFERMKFKQKMNIVLQEITLAPPKTFFETFEGGHEYHEIAAKY